MKESITCPVCGRLIHVLDGTTSEHRNPKQHKRCKGSSIPYETNPALFTEKAQSAN